jgi:hypothetical protein
LHESILLREIQYFVWLCKRNEYGKNESYGQVGCGEKRDSDSVPAATESTQSIVDGALEERSLFILTMHPHITGHRSRIVQLEKLIAYMKSKPGVWFATLEQIATYVKKPGADH